MSIDNNRGDFLAIIVIALLVTAISLFTPLAAVCCILMVGCAAILYQLPEKQAGYVMFGMAVVSCGVASAALINLWPDRPLQLSVAVALLTTLLASLWLIASWSHRRSVLYEQQIVISTAFGIRLIKGPNRIHHPSNLFGTRIIGVMSLRQMKTKVPVSDIDVRPSTDATKMELHPIHSEVAELLRAYGLIKIHAIDLSVCYRIDGPSWFLLNNIPHAQKHTADLSGKADLKQQPEYWEAVTTGYIKETADQVLRRVIQNQAWSAADVRDRREDVSKAFLAELRQETARVGLLIDQVELLTVDVDLIEDLHQARLGSIHIGLQRDILSSMQELLKDPNHPIPAEAIAAIIRSQIHELGRAATPPAGIEDALEDAGLAQEVGGGHHP